jgi:hypothetical protein
MFSQSKSTQRFRWALWSLALLAVLIGSTGGQAQQVEDARQRAAQARFERQLRLRQAHIAPAQLGAEDLWVVQLWTDEQVERIVFQQDGNASGARQRLDSLLAKQIVDIDRACTLTEAQRKKLQLAGRGDIKRFFDRYEAVKQKSQRIEQNEHSFEQIQPDFNRLRMMVQGGLFQESSLLVKSLPNTLTEEQFAQYDAIARERRVSLHRAAVARAVATLQQGIRLRDAQRRALITLITNETKPSRWSGPYDSYILILQLGRLPEEKLKRLFDDDQWQIVNEQLAQFQQLEPMLRQSGQWPAEDDGPDSTEEQPASRKE